MEPCEVTHVQVQREGPGRSHRPGSWWRRELWCMDEPQLPAGGVGLAQGDHLPRAFGEPPQLVVAATSRERGAVLLLEAEVVAVERQQRCELRAEQQEV